MASSINEITIGRSVRNSPLDQFAKKRLLSLLANLERGCLTIEDGEESFQFGEDHATASIRACLQIRHFSAYRDILFGGSVGAGEAFMLGAWQSPDLVALTRLMALNIDLLNKLDKAGAVLQRLVGGLYHWLNRNTEIKARRNIAAHYDLSNSFFSLFLSSDMMYSSAVFPTPEATLEEASKYKLELICRKLQLSEDDHLLEIGTGWGGLAIHAARYYGCRVTTTTISEQQYHYAREKVVREGLDDRIEVLLQDYRQLTGRYDKLVSIEMMEAVGYQYYDRYFSACSQLLKAGGVMLLQVITIPSQRYQQARHSVDFIQRYIFPGGGLPGHQVIAGCLERCTDMQMAGMQELGEHYAQTLRHWRLKFLSALDRVQALGFDTVFIRMWEYYLSYCEGGFRERAIGAAQYVFVKPDWRLFRCSRR